VAAITDHFNFHIFVVWLLPIHILEEGSYGEDIKKMINKNKEFE